MNVSAVSSTQVLQSSNVSSNQAKNQLSDDQKDLISSVLEEYDSSSLSAEDASAIVTAFQDAGIQPSRDLANTMSESGFSAREVGELAGVEGPQGGMPPPPPGGMPPSSNDEAEESALSTLLETLLSSDEDEETSSSYETVSDYTSRIMSLNDDVKSQVKELFDTYSPNNTDLSKEDASKVVINSLSQILGDSNNYNKTTFYA